MSLGLATGGSGAGDFKPIIKYDARAGRVHRIDRTQDASGQFVSEPIEITAGFKAIMDLANIEVGYARFNNNAAPDWAMVKIGQSLPPKPAADYRQGFRMAIKLPAALGGDVREFASVAACVIGSVDGLHNTYLAAPEAKKGKLPIVAMTGTTMIKSGSGAKTSTNYAPTFVITGWVDRPAELAVTAAANGNATAPVVPAPVARPQPMQTPVAAPAMSASEFGQSQGSSDLNDDIPF